jgi:Protein of unknown function (DUF4231)
MAHLMAAAPSVAAGADPILQRLEDQIAWYDRKSLSNQHTFKRIKMVEIVAAAMIPFLAALSFSRVAYLTGALGVLITVLEGMLHLNQYQQNWTDYRSTCETLRHEKFTFLAGAAPYQNVSDPRALLAQRIESAVSQEHAKWTAVQHQDHTAKRN